MNLSTKRLAGIPISTTHRPWIMELNADPRVAATLGGVRTEAEVEAYIDRCVNEWSSRGWGQWALFTTESETFVGRCGIRPYTLDGVEEVELLYAISSDAWGRGYATEAARAVLDWAWANTDIQSVVAFTLPTNMASQRVMQKSGMNYEGTIVHANREHVLYRANRP